MHWGWQLDPAERAWNATNSRAHQTVKAARDSEGCAACGGLQYFRRSFCAVCGAPDPVEKQASGEGTVYATSLVCRAATP